MKPATRILRRALLRQFGNAGWAGALGVSLLVFALAFAFSGNHERRNQLAELASQRAELATQLAHGKQPGTSPREILQHFREGFPLVGDLPDILLKLDASARQHGLAPRRADYGDSAEGGEAADSSRSSGFQRVRINMPVKGGYAAIRAWLADAQANNPTLSIESLELKRPDIGQSELDAQVRLTVYMRGPT